VEPLGRCSQPKAAAPPPARACAVRWSRHQVTRDVRLYPRDILDSIERIESYTAACTS